MLRKNKKTKKQNGDLRLGGSLLYSKHVFYPSVFDLRDTTVMRNPRGALDNTTVPAIMQHFVAYVQGAAGIVPVV